MIVALARKLLIAPMAHGDDRRGARGRRSCARDVTPELRQSLTISTTGCRRARSSITIRGGGNPTLNMALQPRFRMGPPPRSFAADAHGCIMVRPHREPPNTRSRREDAPMASSPQIVAAPALTGLH